VVILALTLVPFGGLGRYEPSAFLQIHVAPFRLEQFADAAEGAQADPYGALHARIDWTDAGVFLAGGQGFVVTLKALEDIAQFANLIWRK